MVYTWYIPGNIPWKYIYLAYTMNIFFEFKLNDVVYTSIMPVLVWLINYSKRNDENETTTQDLHVQITSKAGNITSPLKKHILLRSCISWVYSWYIFVISHTKNLKLPYLSNQLAVWDEPKNRFKNKPYQSKLFFVYNNAKLKIWGKVVTVVMFCT